ncbi:MAG TPA: hypothetical protein VFE27_00315 [Acidobacteriaceae bacterium]|nr:hypothetical protein [Acidobacteriaceae bacterium]
MTTAEATTTIATAIQSICQLQVLIDEGTTEEKQIGRDGMDLVAEQLTALGLLDELISRASWQLYSD